MKFMIIVLFAVIIAANAKVISLADMLKAYEDTNEMSDNAPVATQELYIPMSLKQCVNSICNSACQSVGYNHGTCTSCNSCHCYNN